MKAIDRQAILKYWTEARRQSLVNSKKLLLLPWEEPELLHALDLMNPEGSLTRSQTKKLLQVNHMLGLLRPTLEKLQKQHKVVRIAEGACGHSYVSLLIAWYFKRYVKHPVQILASDSNSKLITESRARAERLGLADILGFSVQGLQDFDWDQQLAAHFPESVTDESKKHRPHLFIALHACDSLSCLAMQHAIQLKTDWLAIAPCCQAELAAQWKLHEKDSTAPLRSVFQSPHLRRSLAADVTDTMRLLLARSLGYVGEAIEFVPSEHTPKNRLLLLSKERQYDTESWASYRDLRQTAAGARPSLERLLETELVARGFAQD